MATTQRERDPSRTTTLRQAFVREMNKRFRRVRVAVRKLVYDDDAFGLKQQTTRLTNAQMLNVEKRVWEFRTDAGKVEAFRSWLKDKVEEEILSTDATGEPWLGTYIESSYKKGQHRAYRQVYGELLDTPQATDLAVGDRLVAPALAGPETVNRIDAIYTRAWNDLRGVTDAMGQKLSRELALGLSEGRNSLDIARRMSKEIDSLTKTRARVIARTEVIASHAEGQLDAYEGLNVTQVTVRAEWLTAGDNRVCGLCAPMEGEVMSIREARGLIPRHPNCRCAWEPVTEKKRSPRKTQKAIKKSIRRASRKGATLRESVEESTWAGKRLLRESND